MNKRIIITEECNKVKQGLNVSLGCSDVRIVAENSEKQAVKRKNRGFRKNMAKDAKFNTSARPVRKIKLNRNIFNTDSTASATIHVKTLSEIKSEKEATKNADKLVPEVKTSHTGMVHNYENNIKFDGNVIDNSVAIENSTVMHARPRQVPNSCTATSSTELSSTVAKSSHSTVVQPNHTIVDTSSTVARTSLYTAAAKSSSQPNTDTRTVVKRESTTQRLLIPNIQLTPITHQNVKAPQIIRRVININHSSGKTPSKIFHRTHKSKVSAVTSSQTISSSPPSRSPAKKRKVSPICLKIPKRLVNSSIVSPSKKKKTNLKILPDSKPISTPVLKDPAPTPTAIPIPTSPVPSPIENPPSPALSLGIQSDDELDTETNLFQSDKSSHRLMSEERTKCKEPFETDKKQKLKPAQNCVHSRLSPPPYTQKDPIPKGNDAPKNFPDDALEVISVIADDDDLFLKGKQSPLKCSLSQGSISSMFDESSMAKEKPVKPMHSVGDLISSKPLPNSFRIPRYNSNERNVTKRNNGEKNQCENSSKQTTKVESISITHNHPKLTRTVSDVGLASNRFSVEEKVSIIHRHLKCKNIHDAWFLIKELEDMKTSVDVKILEEAIKVCELVSQKNTTSKLVEIVKGLFEMLKQKRELQPLGYILTIVTLCRCGKVQEGFHLMEEMIEAGTFEKLQQEVLVHFINDMNKCLRAIPKWIIELLQYIKRFNLSNPTHLINNCLFSLTASPCKTLRDIPASHWDGVISLLCVPPNPQGAMKVQSLMSKQNLQMSDEATTKLLDLYRETRCTKQLLDMLHSVSPKQAYDIASIFADENLNIRDVTAHIDNLIKKNSLPHEDVLHNFIDIAMTKKEFNLIYGLFQKCNSSSLSLSMATLRKMVDALENWDENITASVEVYSAMRQAKLEVKKKVPRPTHLKHKPRGPCFHFLNTGRCNYGSSCKFAHVVDDLPQIRRTISDPAGYKSFEELNQFNQINFKPQTDHIQKFQEQSDFPNTSVPSTMVNGTDHKPLVNGRIPQRFSSFHHHSLNVQMFHPLPQDHSGPSLYQNPVSAASSSKTSVPKHAKHSLNLSINPTPKLVTNNGPFRASTLPVFRSLATRTASNPEKVELNRSFSWEPSNNPTPRLRLSPPSMQFHDASPGSDNNNNSKGILELQQRVERAVSAKNWQKVYLWYVEEKQASGNNVQADDLKLFRSVFAKDIDTVGTNFNEFVDFVYKEKSSVKSYHSGSNSGDVFDSYDAQFLGSLAVSLMEKCLVMKKYNEGFSILHSLHANNISYFEHGKNFGVYYGDIPPSAVAIIAVKLCMGTSEENGLLGALEVLRACNYAIPEAEEDISPENVEYRIKILQQLFNHFYYEENILEAYEILQHLNATTSVMVPLYVKILSHYSHLKDFDHCFEVLAEMHENGFDLNIPICQSLYERFLKHCFANGHDIEVLETLEAMESKEIKLDGKIWKEILNAELSNSNQFLTKKLFQKCIDLGVYPETFSKQTPWLCQLGCEYSRLELKLLIERHLKQLHEHLGELSIKTVKEFFLSLLPRVSENNLNRKLCEGIQNVINRNSLIVSKVLEEDLNPPLTISEQSKEQFHCKFVVDKISLYRWLNACASEKEIDDDDSSSQGSIESCWSRMQELD